MKGYPMVPHRSIDEITIITALLYDVSSTYVEVFDKNACRDTIRLVSRRVSEEGVGFLTKTLPKLGKALDRALSSDEPFDCRPLGFNTLRDGQLPRFLGEFFSRIFADSGILLTHPCVSSVRVLRQVLYILYKYELPYSAEQEQLVVSKFEQTERELENTDRFVRQLADDLPVHRPIHPKHLPTDIYSRVREARRLLRELFRSFDPHDIKPRHGPGTVATKQRLWGKYQWSNISRRIRDVYPVDSYYFVNLEHVADRQQELLQINDEDLPARVILVPKDSRGPRLISCEPVDYQWIQQGLGRAISELVERHPLTRDNVRFTDQQPNQFGALMGSVAGKYATLDLAEASDRVSLDLVRLLFPSNIVRCLEACRTSATVLPDGRVLPLNKFAPMGSSLCFPILSLVVWSLLTAGTWDTGTREGTYVYGDDVIVPTAYAGDAIELLETFGLKVNRDKSCIKGLFRESCGMDAYRGEDVTPVRLRTVWSSLLSADVLTSWCEYCNAFIEREKATVLRPAGGQYRKVASLIAGGLVSVYGAIPHKDMDLPCPSLLYVPDETPTLRIRTNHVLQKREWRVWTTKSKKSEYLLDGWSCLLRHFTEAPATPMYENVFVETEAQAKALLCHWDTWISDPTVPFSVSSYTHRHTSTLVRRWR